MSTDVPPRPSELTMRRMLAVLAPMRRWVDPKVSGLENVPRDRGSLIVGNHSLFGAYDLLISTELYQRAGMIARGLVDRDHQRIPGWWNLFTAIGGVEGSRDNCAELMRQGEVIIVFPGGSREVWKKPGQRYQLLWGDRLGFVRLAIEHGYPIVPLSQLGADEMYDIHFHIEHPLAGPYRAVVDRLGVRRNNVPSFGLGWSGTPLPRPQDAYLHFSPPIETTAFAGRHEDRETLESVRDRVAAAIQDGIKHLSGERARRGNPGLARRLTRFITGGEADDRRTAPLGSAVIGR